MNNKILTYSDVFDKKYNSPTERLINLAKAKENLPLAMVGQLM